VTIPGAAVTSSSLLVQATIPAVFAAAGTSFRGVSILIHPILLELLQQASYSSEEEGDFQDDVISWNRKQPAKRRKRSTVQSFETEDSTQDSSSHAR